MENPDGLDEFRRIAADCSEEELVEIIADCESDPYPEVYIVIKAIYQGHLDRMRSRQKEIDYFESTFNK
jgi:hypothetical protein